MSATTDAIQDYVNLLAARGETVNYIERFYVFYDEDLQALEADLADSDQSEAFYDAVIAVYRQWMMDMGPEKWAEVEAYDARQSGANRNWLIGDELLWPDA